MSPINQYYGRPRNLKAKKIMASNEHLRLIKSHILHECDKLCLIKTMVEDKNSQTRISAVRHRIACRLNKHTEYSLTCGLWPWAYATPVAVVTKANKTSSKLRC